MKKKQIVSTVLFCLLIAAIVSISFVIFANSKENTYPFDEQINMAKHDSVEIKNIDNIEPNENGEITIDQLKQIPDNAMLGEIKYKDSSVQVVYNCNDVSLIETATLIKNGDFVGEIGCAKIYGYRANMVEFMKIPVGDKITISMPYGDYIYKCVNKATAKSDWDISRQNFDIDRGLILYSDEADDYGFSNDYNEVVFEMVSGPKIVG